MNVEEELSRSLWMDLAPIDVPSLSGPLTTDVLVIGAGIAGLSTAYELALRGRQVTVVDRGRPARGMSARTSAHLTFEIDDYNVELIKVRDLDAARQYYASQCAAVDRIEEICSSEGIECDFARVDGYFVPAWPEDVDHLRKELAASLQAGFPDAEWLERGPGPWATSPAIRYPRQARFHPLKYLYGLLAVLRARGVEIYGHTPVDALEEQEDRVFARCGEGRSIVANAVVVATNSPFHLGVPIHTKQAPYRTYVIAAPVPQGSVPDVLVWDTLEPGYHYVRLQPSPGHDVLIVGGEDHKTGEEADMLDRFTRLETWARALFPTMGEVTHRWSGQVMEPADYVPFIGRSPQHERVWLVTGDSGQGLTTGVVASLLLCEQVNGGEHPWGKLYDPSRKMLHGLREYLTENLDAARHWAAHLGGGDIESVDQLAAGQGAIARIDGEAVAAYRTPEGALRLFSAACTHVGCVVRWNGFERCWDCPCHGSQFSVDGEPLQGPAHRPLKPFVPQASSVRRRASGE
ncbi:MAG TPA: FAD-dependent oxidoreductase [Steroidobacteraceae bacterium]|nr:FAD-dependent oxidoreductase [Steroidobacteraceae bacterium]